MHNQIQLGGEVLQDHQIVVARYLAARAQLQKGILAIHSLGSGKTRTAIAFAQNFPRHRVIVFAPPGLSDDVWEHEKAKLGVSLAYEYVSLSDAKGYLLSSGVENAVVIVDEAHRLPQILLKASSPAEIVACAKALSKAYKCLLLTATPVYHDTSDIRWLINIAAGKAIIPVNLDAFTRKYYVINRQRAFVRGWLQAILASNVPMMSLIVVALAMPVFKWGNYGARLTDLHTENPTLFNLAVPVVQESASRTDYYAAHLTGLLSNSPAAKVLLRDKSISFQADQLLAGLKTPFVLRVLATLRNPPKDWYVGKVLAVSQAVGSGMAVTRRSRIFLATYFAPLSVMIALTVMAVVSRNYSPVLDRVFDANRFAQDIQSYVSVYNRPLESADYPKVRSERVDVQYSSRQIEIWIKFTMGLLQPDELVSLEIYDSLQAASIFGNTTSLDIYRDKGRIIGNMMFGDEDVPKFRRMYQEIVSAIGPVVVYSNFIKSGGMLLSYLRDKGLAVELYTTSLEPALRKDLLLRFHNRKLDVLILDPVYTEGLSLKGAAQLHIMEPIAERAKRDQVIGRVVRFRSHVHLPASYRNVRVYEWYCVTTGWQKRLEKAMGQMSTWLQTQADIAYWKREIVFDQKLSPDEIVMQSQDKTSSDVQLMYDAMAKNNTIEALVPKDSSSDPCCVWLPQQTDQVANCIQGVRCSDLDP